MKYQFYIALMLISIADIWPTPGNCVPISRRRNGERSALEGHRGDEGNTAELGYSPAVAKNSRASHTSTTYQPHTSTHGHTTFLTSSSSHHTQHAGSKAGGGSSVGVEHADSSIMRVNSDQLHTNAPSHAAKAGALSVQSHAPTKSISEPQIERKACSACGKTIAAFPGSEDICVTCERNEHLNTHVSKENQYCKSSSASHILAHRNRADTE